MPPATAFVTRRSLRLLAQRTTSFSLAVDGQSCTLSPIILEQLDTTAPHRWSTLPMEKYKERGSRDEAIISDGRLSFRDTLAISNESFQFKENKHINESLDVPLIMAHRIERSTKFNYFISPPLSNRYYRTCQKFFLWHIDIIYVQVLSKSKSEVDVRPGPAQLFGYLY